MPAEGPGRQALAAIDAALAGKPRKNDQAFTDAVAQLCVLRQRMTERARTEGATAAGRRRLEHLNSVLTVVLAGHFPLGSIPWDEVAKARGWLVELLADAA